MITNLKNEITSGKTTLFCGAGISFNSGIPLVNAIKAEIISGLILEKTEADFLKSYNIPFELFMECLIENSDNEDLLNLFEFGIPNSTHFYIAEMARMGYFKNIITTNFDNLLEQAFEKLNVQYNLIYKDENFDRIDWNSHTVNLIKLHGSIHDKRSMAITIKKVASRSLVYQRNNVIQNILQNSISNRILVLGYSCSDLFDINPTIVKLNPKNVKIFYIKHKDSEKFEPTYHSLIHEEAPDIFKDYNGNLVLANTDILLKQLWHETINTPYIDVTSTKANPGPIVQNWLTKLNIEKGEGFYEYLAGNLLIITSSFYKAITYLSKGLISTEKHGNHNLSIDFLYSIGRAYQSVQKSQDSILKSIEYLEQGLDKCRHFKFRKKECFMLLSLGIAYEDKKEHKNAIDLYNSAYEIAKELNETIIVSKCLGNIGIALKNIALNSSIADNYLYNIALIFQNQSLQISIDEGDKRSEGRTYGNIAAILTLQNKKAEAIEFSKKALFIACEISDTYHEGIWRHNIGDDYIGIDNDLSEKYLLEAKKIFTEGQWEIFLATCNDTLIRLKKAKETNP